MLSVYFDSDLLATELKGPEQPCSIVIDAIYNSISLKEHNLSILF